MAMILIIFIVITVLFLFYLYTYDSPSYYIRHERKFDLKEGKSIWYEVAGVPNKKFKMIYVPYINFPPEKLSMEIGYRLYPQSFNREHNTNAKMKYIVTRSTVASQVNEFEVIMPTKEGYTSMFYAIFTYNDFMVDYFFLDSDDLGKCGLYGLVGRGFLSIESKNQKKLVKPVGHETLSIPKLSSLPEGKVYILTFMNYLSKASTYIMPLKGRCLKLPKMAYIEFHLMNIMEYTDDIVYIMDLVEIEIGTKPSQRSSFFITRDYKIDIRIFDIDRKRIGRAIYSLSHHKAKFDDTYLPGSSFMFCGIDLKEINITTNPFGYFDRKFLGLVKGTSIPVLWRVAYKMVLGLKTNLIDLKNWSESCFGSRSKEEEQIGYENQNDSSDNEMFNGQIVN
ncbi:hypothetical protein RF11_01590 [Thelohanellus kitauei]|uniref:Uncharacterized protein n=1 Tax=Thelohanellus kitauei TaxID=669202 RepID=A0A0C2JQN8_THEKT|nr:hypothetical protein RF11_01590 [Thelohanellus kitauei]